MSRFRLRGRRKKSKNMRHEKYLKFTNTQILFYCNIHLVAFQLKKQEKLKFKNFYFSHSDGNYYRLRAAFKRKVIKIGILVRPELRGIQIRNGDGIRAVY